MALHSSIIHYSLIDIMWSNVKIKVTWIFSSHNFNPVEKVRITSISTLSYNSTTTPTQYILRRRSDLGGGGPHQVRGVLQQVGQQPTLARQLGVPCHARLTRVLQRKHVQQQECGVQLHRLVRRLWNADQRMKTEELRCVTIAIGITYAGFHAILNET